MITVWNRKLGRPLFLVLVLGMLTGCASVFQDLDNRIHHQRFKTDYETLERALTTYDEGHYELARSRFSALQADSTSPIIVRRAWLGEICCRLLLADSPAEYTAAISMWHEFTRTQPDGVIVWDPKLIDPLIVRMVPAAAVDIGPGPGRQPLPEAPAKPAAGDKSTPIKRVQRPPRLEPDLAALKKKAEQAAQLQRKLDEVVAENNALKAKIKALETIDQNIQKKKTEISAPSE